MRSVTAQEISEILASSTRKRPQNAQTTFTRTQSVTVIVLMLLTTGSLIMAPLATTVTIIATCVLGFTLLFLLKSFLTMKSITDGMIKVTDEELASLKDEELPLYTILIPLRGEARIVHELVDGLRRIDYPVDKLQILLLLEANDPSTVQAVSSLHLQQPFEVLVLDDIPPHTKPKASTVGLMYAKGDFVVVYDAEDRVESDQLRKVVAAYRRFGEDIWCIQAKLEYHNTSQNPLTQLFAGEYATYFNLVLPALGNLDLIVPLGGTSNHFRTHRLQEMGGWDAYNVTEDLDLGIQIKRKQGLVKVIESVTWEEANSRLGILRKGGWIPQRSRWIKGHMQSWLVHMRSPVQLLRDLGVINFVIFQILVGGTPAALLLSPLFFCLTIVYVFSRILLPNLAPELGTMIQQGIEVVFPSIVFYMGVISFLVGNIALTYYLLMGCMFRQLYSSVKWMLLAPLYWILMSMATWKAFFQLVTKPHYWEKSEHGHLPAPAKNIISSLKEAIARISATL